MLGVDSDGFWDRSGHLNRVQHVCCIFLYETHNIQAYPAEIRVAYDSCGPYVELHWQLFQTWVEVSPHYVWLEQN